MKTQIGEIVLTRVSMLSINAAAKAIKRDKKRIYMAIRNRELIPIRDRGGRFITVWQLEEWQRKMEDEPCESLQEIDGKIDTSLK